MSAASDPDTFYPNFFSQNPKLGVSVHFKASLYEERAFGLCMPNVPTLKMSSSFPSSFPFRGAIIERALSLASRAHEFPGRCFCAGGTSHEVVVVVFCLLLRLGVVGTGCCFPSEWKRKKRRLLGHVSDFIRD